VNTAADPKECPYVGLDPFEAAHSDYFFGRSRDSKIIADHVSARPVTILYGPSGVGKTSILNVGLPKALAHGRGWMIAVLRDWQNPDSLERLAVKAVLRAVPSPQRLAVKAALQQVSRPHHPTHQFGLTPLIAHATRATGRRLVLVFDQFEEYFLYRLHRDRDQTRALEVAMGDLVVHADPPLHVLVALRDDALYRLDELRAFVPGILDTTIKLGHLDDASVKEAITGPVDRYNNYYRKGGRPITVENELVATLIKQLKETGRDQAPAANADKQPIELSYLQLALTKLWSAEGGAKAAALREATLIGELGGVRRIIRDHVNSVMGGLTPEDQTLCAKLFDRLVTGIGSKIAYPTEGLAAADVAGPDVSQARVEAVLGKLTPKESRILKPVTTGGLPGFEIFHDVLGLPVLEWRRRFLADERRQEELAKAEAQRREELAKAEAQRQEELAKAEAQRQEELAKAEAQRQEELAKAEALRLKELADAEAQRRVESAEAEKRLAAERAEAEKREALAALAAERAELEAQRRIWQARHRARRILGAVVGGLVLVFVLVTWVAGWQVALQREVDRLTQFALADSRPEFRLRLLLSLAALDEVSRSWHLTSKTPVLELLGNLLSHSPRDGGTYRAFGVSADGTHIAWVKQQRDEQIVVCSLINTETCAASSGQKGSYSVQLPKPRVPSKSQKLLTGFTKSAVGFLGNDLQPVYYEAGVLFYRRNESWIPVDIATLVPDLESLPGRASVEFANGTMRVYVNDWLNNTLWVTIVSKFDGEPPFTSRPTQMVVWPGSQGPLDNPPPIISSQGDYAFLKRQDAPTSDAPAEDALRSQEVLVVGPANGHGRVEVVLDESGEGSRNPAAARSAGAIGFSGEGRYIAARHPYFLKGDQKPKDSVKVFDVSEIIQDNEKSGGGQKFTLEQPARLTGNAIGNAWWSPPLGVLASTDNRTHWLFAWIFGPTLAVLSAEPEGKLSLQRSLHTGMESTYRIAFSPDGRFVFAQAFAGFGIVSARVWDLSDVWTQIVANAIGDERSVRQFVCHVASFEEPQGDQLTPEEKQAWDVVAQPCPKTAGQPGT
jgi:hypothetical protein